MAESTPEKDHAGFVPLRIACARVYRAVTGKAPQGGSAQWDPLLDTVAIALSTMARIHATDPLTDLLFPLSSTELLRGRFEHAAGRFVLDGYVRYAGLYVPSADVEDAIRLLASARTPVPDFAGRQIQMPEIDVLQGDEPDVCQVAAGRRRDRGEP